MNDVSQYIFMYAKRLAHKNRHGRLSSHNLELLKNKFKFEPHFIEELRLRGQFENGDGSVDVDYLKAGLGMFRQFKRQS